MSDKTPDYFPSLPNSDDTLTNSDETGHGVQVTGEMLEEFDPELHEKDGAIIRFILHLNTGSDVEVYIHDPELEVDTFNEVEFLSNMAEQFNGDRPQWAQLGNVIFFTGAVTAIQAEEHFA